jgi:tRNA threonylcarbamoyladenosine biosynthesis protein TsaE
MGDSPGRPEGEKQSTSTSSEAETVAVGRSFATRLNAGAVVLLFGDLGAGKTAFVRGVAEGLGVGADQVSSPTFTLIQEYRGGRLPLFHVDLYRLGIAQEIDELGLEELGEGGVLAIEWADKLPRVVSGSIVVRIEQGEGDDRRIEISS